MLHNTDKITGWDPKNYIRSIQTLGYVSPGVLINCCLCQKRTPPYRERIVLKVANGSRMLVISKLGKRRFYSKDSLKNVIDALN